MTAVNGKAGARRHLLAACRASKVLCLLMQNQGRLIDEGSVAIVATRLLLLSPLLFLLSHLFEMLS